ncbi:MAG: hypothetical protein ACREOB_11390, partial [Thermodesulfobacteriota bacterium]
MPVRVCTGFEHGVTNATSLVKGNVGNRFFDSINGTAYSIITSPVRNGSRALQLNPSAANAALGWTSDTYGTSQTRLVLHVAIRFPTSLPAADVTLIEFFNLNSDYGLYFRNSDDKLVLSLDGVIAFGAVGPTVVADTWYVVEIYIDLSANPWTGDWSVDTVVQTQETLAVAASNFNLGVFLGNDNSETFTCIYDDVVLWTDTVEITGYPFGKHKVLQLIPDTGGTTAEIGTANATGRMVTNSAINATHNSADILAAISEVPPLIGATATGVGQRTSGAGNAVGIPMTSYTL